MKMKCIPALALTLVSQVLFGQTLTIDSGFATSDYLATDGATWKTDASFTGGDGLYTSSPIQNTNDSALYRTARYGLYSNFGYKIPVSAGSYNVTLKFAEIKYSTPGQRVFNATINGAQVLTNFDILAHTAPLTAFDQTFSVDASNGLIDISFAGVVNGGIVNAILIAPASSVVIPPPPVKGSSLSASPGSLTFAGTAGSGVAGQVLSIGSTDAALAWTAGSVPSWLTLSAGSGTTPSAVTVTPNPAGLAPGAYNANIVISAQADAGSPVTVPVSLTLASPSAPPPAGGSDFYVAPTGSSSGDGSIGRPWDLQTALKQPAAVKPGSTLWLRGGTYGGNATEFTSYLAGTDAAPILVKPYPGERATIDGGLAVYGPYTWYWGFEIMSSNPNRAEGAVRQECMDTYPGSTGVKIINMVLHDCLQGVGFFVGAIDAEMSGNLIYFNGETGTSRGIGHGIYTQNQTGTKHINDNIIFDTFDIGFQGYGSGNAFVKGYDLDGNVSFNNGSPVNVHVDNILFAVGSGLDNISIRNSYTYHTPGANLGYSRLGWMFGANNNGTLNASGNYWIGGGGGEASLELWGWNNINYTNNVSYATSEQMLMLHSGALGTANYSFDNNRYYGSGLMGVDGVLGGIGTFLGKGLETHSQVVKGRPTGLWAFVRPNRYEAGRANVILYNWDLSPQVAVDLSAVLKPGDSFVVRDSENYYGAPVASGTFTGDPVSIPMTGLPKAVPVGYKAIAHTAPEFGVFIVSRQ